MQKTVVYNRHTTAKQSAETAEASLSGEQSGTTPSTSMNAPTQTLFDFSSSKDNTKDVNLQENEGKSIENQYLVPSDQQENSALSNTTDTDKTPKGNGNDTATPESTVSDSKDKEFIVAKQEKSKKKC